MPDVTFIKTCFRAFQSKGMTYDCPAWANTSLFAHGVNIRNDLAFTFEKETKQKLYLHSF
jgi:hypothetical protein